MNVAVEFWYGDFYLGWRMGVGVAGLCVRRREINGIDTEAVTLTVTREVPVVSLVEF